MTIFHSANIFLCLSISCTLFASSGEIEKVTATSFEDTISKRFTKTSQMEINQVKFGTVLFVDMECKNSKDCETSRFTLSSRALSAKDQDCIEVSQCCRYRFYH